MPAFLEHPDVKVSVEELSDGKRSLAIEPTNASVFIPARYYVPSYPVDLIWLILRAKGAYLIDEIKREEDRGYVRRHLPGGATLLRPAGIKDGIDLWHRLSGGRAVTKRLMKAVFKSIYSLSGVALVPYHLNLAIRKGADGAGKDGTHPAAGTQSVLPR